MLKILNFLNEHTRGGNSSYYSDCKTSHYAQAILRERSYDLFETVLSSRSDGVVEILGEKYDVIPGYRCSAYASFLLVYHEKETLKRFKKNPIRITHDTVHMRSEHEDLVTGLFEIRFYHRGKTSAILHLFKGQGKSLEHTIVDYCLAKPQLSQHSLPKEQVGDTVIDLICKALKNENLKHDAGGRKYLYDKAHYLFESEVAMALSQL